MNFESISIRGITFKNRIIRSATHEAMADDLGAPTDELAKVYERLAKGQIGGILTGFIAIRPDGRSSAAKMLMLDNDNLISKYKRLIEIPHKSNIPIIAQLVHCGRQTRSMITGLPLIAPSPIRDDYFCEDVPCQLTSEMISAIINDFVLAIERAKRIGFDGVQLHLGHGYLLSSFLSKYSNKRTDEWGGTLEKRFRIVKEIFTHAKVKVGDYPIMVKLNWKDERKNGMQLEEAIKIAKMLEVCGCAAIEVTCGTFADGMHTVRCEIIPIEALFKYCFKFKNIPSVIKNILKPVLKKIINTPRPLKLYNLEAAKSIKEAVNIPIIAVGGFSDLKDIETGLTYVDLVSISRALIIEPDLINKYQSGLQTKAKCKQCAACVIGVESNQLRCYQDINSNFYK